MNLYDLHKNPIKLNHRILAHTHVPRIIWLDGMSKEWYKEREDLWAKDAKYACFYARMNKSSFPKGEEAIAKSAEQSFLYAADILMTPFPKGEDAIAKDAEFSYCYASNNKKPFIKGEDAIAKSASFSYHYAKDILKAPFQKGEDAIAKDEYYKQKYEQEFGIKL